MLEIFRILIIGLSFGIGLLGTCLFSFYLFKTFVKGKTDEVKDK